MALIVQMLESASIGASTPSPATITLATGVPGPQGLSATVEVGSTTTLAPGSSATVVNSGTSSAAVLDFGIPAGEQGQQGQQGQQGIQGIQGPQGVPGATGVIAATAPLAYNSGTQTVSIDLSAYLTISAAAATYYPSTNPSGFITSSALSGYATQTWVSSQGYLTASALTPYLTSATAASTYQTIAGMSAYLTTASATSTYLTQTNAASTYQTQSGMSAYLTTSAAASTYAPLARGIPAGGTAGQVLSKVNGTDYSVAWTTVSSSSAAWGSITGTLSAQTDLDTALGLKAPLASPALTGTPTAPTATAGTSTTQIATTAFVTAVDILKANIASPTFTGTVTIPAGASISGFAPLASPTFTGDPKAPTPATSDNDTSIATTAFVKAQGYTTTPGDRYATSSTTSNAISNGTKTFTVGSGLSYTPTQDVTIAYTGDPLNYHMHAQVVSYSGTTLVVNVAQHTGTGTFATWTINVGGISSYAIWGSISGTLSNQTDLQNALDAKLTDAPSDGNYYIRKDAAWEVVTIF